MNREEILRIVSENVNRVERLIEVRPILMSTMVREKLRVLRETFLEERAPRIAFAGRCGTGMSTLINALLGEKVRIVGNPAQGSLEIGWCKCQGSLGRIEILDIRGFHGNLDTEKEEESSLNDIIKLAINGKAPDAVFFLHKAGEIGIDINPEVECLKRYIKAVKSKHGFRPPVFGLVTQCDQLSPINVCLSPKKDEDPFLVHEKLSNIYAAAGVLRRALLQDNGLRLDLVDVIQVVGDIAWRRDDTIRRDYRWNIEKLVACVFHELPNQARVRFARLTQVRDVQKELAQLLVQAFSTLVGVPALVPFPIYSVGSVTALQTAMVSGIGYVGGSKMDGRTAREFMNMIGALIGAVGVNLGAALILKKIAKAADKWIFAGVGYVFSGTLAAITTWALGKAAIARFIDLRTVEEAKEVFEKTKYLPRDSKSLCYGEEDITEKMIEVDSQIS